MLAKLEGGCQVPIGGHAVVSNGRIALRGVVISVDGSRKLIAKLEGSDPVELGFNVAQRLLDQGAGEILSAI